MDGNHPDASQIQLCIRGKVHSLEDLVMDELGIGGLYRSYLESPQSCSHLQGMYRLSYGRPIYSTPIEEEDGRLKLAVVYSCINLPEGSPSR